MILTGEMLIGQQTVAGRGEAVHGINPATGEQLEPAYPGGSTLEADRACGLAWSAFDHYRESSQADRARFLETIADEIEALGDELVERAVAESGLAQGRIQGERGRTCGQLRLFAEVVRAGEWLDVRVETALPDRQPLPRADHRQRHVALGPVVVFGASNFPLAFSVAGGDTASALAAGCPVVVKAHAAHPGTSELVGRAIQKAVRRCNLPEGVFSLLYGSGREVGVALVQDWRIKAGGFTGSRSGGMALWQAAQTRPEPIPFYAEMSSINPVYLLPEALHQRGEEIGRALVNSVLMGAGQFCTNPGLVIARRGEELDRCLAAASEAMKEAGAQVMLTAGIHQAYEQGVAGLNASGRVQELARGRVDEGPSQCRAGLFATSAADFLRDEALQGEVFGASSLIIKCDSDDEIMQVTEHLEGQLTATLQMDDGDLHTARRLLPILERKAGRILVNDFPTGVEVCHSMVHGGPFPATSDSRTTSVGTAAIYRFLRPVCYQSMPETLLPEAVRSDNPLSLRRLVNGRRET